MMVEMVVWRYRWESVREWREECLRENKKIEKRARNGWAGQERIRWIENEWWGSDVVCGARGVPNIWPLLLFYFFFNPRASHLSSHFFLFFFSFLVSHFSSLPQTLQLVPPHPPFPPSFFRQCHRKILRNL